MEKSKFYKKISNQKGAISIFTVLAMIFFLMFILGAFAFSSRRNQTQVQSLSDLREVYKQDSGDMYDEVYGDLESGPIPIYYEKDFYHIQDGVIRTINGENYLFAEDANYVLKNDIKIDLEKKVNSEYKPKDYTIYDGRVASNGSAIMQPGSFDVYYMYDTDKDGETEKFKLVAYSKVGEIPASQTSEEKNFNIIGDGEGLTVNLDAYIFDKECNFLVVEHKSSKTNISELFSISNKSGINLEDIDNAYKDKSGNTLDSAEQYFVFVRAEDDKIKTYIEGLPVVNIGSIYDEEIITVVIANNTRKAINYKILDLESENFVIEWINEEGNEKVELKAKEQKKEKVKIKAKDGLFDSEEDAEDITGDNEDLNTDTDNDDEIEYDFLEIIEVEIEREYLEGVKTNLERLTVYINAEYNFKDLIFAHNEIRKDTPDFTENVTTVASSGLFETEDESGTTQYFRGVVENNYVEFANKTWRIVRINGDGSYRLVLNGYTGDKVFFSDTDSNFANSIVKTKLQEWYSNNLSLYDSYIDKNAIFWSDRTYGARGRISNLTSTTSKTYPTLIPINEDDIFSVNEKNLKHPIGLLTADELVLAGATTDGYPNDGKHKENYDFYLHCSQDTDGTGVGVGYWTMTPASTGTLVVSKPQAGVYVETYTKTARSIRPVINLKSTVMAIGTGTKDDPYVITSDEE